MSRHPSGERIAGDRYYTPDEVALACLRTFAEAVPLDGRRVLEPSCGGGAFVRTLRQIAPCAQIIGVDADPEAAGLQACDVGHVADFLSVSPAADVVVGNPPYRQAEAHIEHAIGLAPDVGMLVRMMLLAGVKRRSFWRAYPPASVHVIVPRPSFTGSGTDACDYMWVRWSISPPAAPSLGWINWR